ncbi:MAG: carboxypeptidase-like regulatory domain-containing protein [Terriglobales bacterium]|jgi:hypothetical protein|nr:hypothetical protein [Terriglobales bacterium]
MKRFVTIFGLALLLTACSKTPSEAGLTRQGITVCGTLTDENHQPVANAFIELHHSAKDPTVIQSRYQVGRTDDKGQFAVQGITQGQYWMAVVPKGSCNPKSKDENESRRVDVDVPNGTPGPQCKTQWQVVQDASCKVTVQ